MGVELSRWIIENVDSIDSIDLLRREDWAAVTSRASGLSALPDGSYTLNSEYLVQLEGSETEPFPEPVLRPSKRTVAYVPSSDIVSLVVDRDTEASGRGVKVGVIDTGLTPKGPQWAHSTPEVHRVRGFTNGDWHGHGSHISSLIGGAPAETEYGLLTGIAPGVEIVSIKAFNPAGSTSTRYILKAMERAIELGCNIVNISSGSTQHEDVDAMEEHKLMAENPEVIFVCAAGNGANDWAISAPGVSPHAITVGSVSFNDGELSYFNSLGPSGEWYQNHPEEFEADKKKYGDALIKPDFVAPGGGRAEAGMRPIEVITSSGGGWYGAYYDGKRDGFMSAQGTSQAAPVVAGIIALLMEEGKVRTADDVRSRFYTKQEAWGYGVPLLSKFGA
tara:strand:- start:473 stop:1642 length:1170 start_codon:yes stop_codon:yes gene_type:complete